MENSQIEYVSIKAINPYTKNARLHSEEQIENIMESITKFGFNNPILIDEKNIIIAGHGRYAAAKKLELSKIPIIVLSHLTEMQKKAYILADNKIALNATWEYDLLAEEIKKLDADDFDLDVIGFSDQELEGLLDNSFSNDTNLDHKKEWDGMPEFDQGDAGPYRTILVHFFDQEGVNKFANLMNHPITGKTKYTWFPEPIIEKVADKRYSE